MTSEFTRFTAEVVKNLEQIDTNLEWMGVRDPRLQPAAGDSPAEKLNDFQEPWDFLESGNFVSAKIRTVAHVSRLCVARLIEHTTDFAAMPSPLGGGSVLLEFNRGTDIARFTGEPFLEHGFLGTSKLGAKLWAGVALPKPAFGLTSFLREVTATPPPYCEDPWVVGYEWFVQGMNEHMTEALASQNLAVE